MTSTVEWEKFFRSQYGGGGQFYKGLPYQRGYGLGNIFKTVMKFLAPVAKSVGRQALSTGAEIVGDWAGGTPLKQAAKRRGRKAVGNLARQAVSRMSASTQKGRGRRRKKGRSSVKKGGSRKKGKKRLQSGYGALGKRNKKTKSRRRKRKINLGILKTGKSDIFN